jgi:hypothetical protein
LAAKGLFNYTWTLLEMADRTAHESEMMLDSAHASRLFWDGIGTPVNHARGEWQISRVYATLARAEPALHHAQRCLDICVEHTLGAFDLGFAYEALARAHAVAGNKAQVAQFYEKACATAELITPTDDRNLLLADLETVQQ